MDGTATLVTGVSRGIGRAIAERLARSGQTIIGLSRSKPEGYFPGEHHAVDLGDGEATRAAMAEITARHKVVRLVNNAGIGRMAPVEQIKTADLAAVLDVNVRAAMQCLQACLPAMREARFGRVLNIGSRAALGKEGRSSYAISKGALGCFTRAAALELAADGITVNCIAPGPIETELFTRNNAANPDMRRAFEARVPVGRLGTPQDIAAAAAYFLSVESGFTTGQVLYICGGMTAGLAPI
ncbi:MAG: SDR family oxidoreductase [Hyphomicrobiaceae bacterium]|nr:SDR family oxidoreductase [Hyphomicrobiaceae bacterium]